MNGDKFEAEPEERLEDAGSAGPDTDPEDLAIASELVELERAAGGVSNEEGENSPPGRHAQAVSDDKVVSPDVSMPQLKVLTETVKSIELGSDARGLVLSEEWAKLEQAVKALPAPVRKRLRKMYGIGNTLALAQIENPKKDDTDNLQLETYDPMRLPQRRLEEFATTLLIDAGVQTREGVRSGGLSLFPGGNPDGGYVILDPDTETRGYLTLPGLVEQLHLALAYSIHAWTGFETLKNAGREGSWVLNEGNTRRIELGVDEQAMLEAAHQIDGILDPAGAASDSMNSTFTALEQARITTEALASVGPSARVAVGWPGASRIPDARIPEDVARVAAVATVLLRGVRTISNRLIAEHMIGNWSDGGFR